MVKLNILLCCTGNVTNERMQQLLASLNNLSKNVGELHVRVVVTEQSRSAFKDDSLTKLAESVYTDEDEWNLWQGRGDPVLHIDLTKWADILVIAPLDLNTLAKIAIGICDNLLTCTVRAWNIKKPLIFCPALTTEAREQQLTKSHLRTLQYWGYKVLLPSLGSEVSTKNFYEYPMAESDEIANLVVHMMSEKR